MERAPVNLRRIPARKLVADVRTWAMQQAVNARDQMRDAETPATSKRYHGPDQVKEQIV